MRIRVRQIPIRHVPERRIAESGIGKRRAGSEAEERKVARAVEVVEWIETAKIAGSAPARFGGGQRTCGCWRRRHGKGIRVCQCHQHIDDAVGHFGVGELDQSLRIDGELLVDIIQPRRDDSSAHLTRGIDDVGRGDGSHGAGSSLFHACRCDRVKGRRHIRRQIGGFGGGAMTHGPHAGVVGHGDADDVEPVALRRHRDKSVGRSFDPCGALVLGLNVDTPPIGRPSRRFPTGAAVTIAGPPLAVRLDVLTRRDAAVRERDDVDGRCAGRRNDAHPCSSGGQAILGGGPAAEPRVPAGIDLRRLRAGHARHEQRGKHQGREPGRPERHDVEPRRAQESATGFDTMLIDVCSSHGVLLNSESRCRTSPQTPRGRCDRIRKSPG